jgi:hypothetical protein
MPSHEARRELVRLAGCAPSPHNIQPARWRFAGDAVELLEDTSRWLSVGDPTGRDNRVALGMAWEGMAIALSQLGLQLSCTALHALPYPPAAGLRVVATGTLHAGAQADPLHAAIDRRGSWRGKFAAATPEQRATLDTCIAAHHPVALPLPEAAIAPLADWHDRAAAEGLADPAFARELYHWMRFSPRSKGWARDGLATDCMALSRAEGIGASFALRPASIRALNALSLTRFVVAEADKTRSGTRLLLITQPPQADPFESGRAWYRFWLALHAAGFAGVPLSALSDSPGWSRKLLEAWPLPPGRALLNVMRVGPSPVAMPRSARLPPAELLLD